MKGKILAIQGLNGCQQWQPVIIFEQKFETGKEAEKALTTYLKSLSVPTLTIESTQPDSATEREA
jgi:hypothetical protein